MCYKITANNVKFAIFLRNKIIMEFVLESMFWLAFQLCWITNTTFTGLQSLPLTMPPKTEEKRCSTASGNDTNLILFLLSAGHRCSQGEHHEARRRTVPSVLQGRGCPLPQHRVRPDDRGQHHHAARLQASAVWRYGSLYQRHHTFKEDMPQKLS